MKQPEPFNPMAWNIETHDYGGQQIVCAQAITLNLINGETGESRTCKLYVEDIDAILTLRSKENPNDQ